jgi:DeoR/GlpR family transcriptional regulator of sugar metabolism
MPDPVRSCPGWGCRPSECRDEAAALGLAVRRRGSVPVTELGYSEMTIRRDLNVLERDGVIRRVHGSEVAASLWASEKPYPVRTILAADQDQAGIVTFGHVCPLPALKRMVTDAPPASTADLRAPGLAIVTRPVVRARWRR